MAGTSAGARKGWETRRRKGEAPAKKALPLLRAAPVTRPLPKSPKPKKAPAKPQRLIPVGVVPYEDLNPYAVANPKALLMLYGNHQLEAALSRYSFTALKKSAEHYGVSVKRGKAAQIRELVAFARR